MARERNSNPIQVIYCGIESPYHQNREERKFTRIPVLLYSLLAMERTKLANFILVKGLCQKRQMPRKGRVKWNFREDVILSPKDKADVTRNNEKV